MSLSIITADLDFIRRVDTISIEDVPLVDGRNASLGEMARQVALEGNNLANGFAITAEAQIGDLDDTIAISSPLAG